MVKKVSQKRVTKNNYKNFYQVANNFYNAAELAEEFEYHNAAGVLYIHSAIAYSDSITIKFSSKKCSGENHYEIIAMLKDILVDNDSTKSMLNHLKKLIDHKNLVSYSGDIYGKKDIIEIKKHFERFKSWVEDLLS